MTSTRIDQLTGLQRDCLRLVHSHHNSKEIAAIVGVSPSAIDKRIERAVQVLQVATRFEAARMLARHEQPAPEAAPPPTDGIADPFTPPVTPTPPAPNATYERLPSEPFDVSSQPQWRAIPVGFEPWGLVRRFLGLDVRSGWEGTARNRSSRGDRMVRMIGLVGLIAIISMVMVNLATTVSSLVRHDPDRSVSAQGAAPAEPRYG